MASLTESFAYKIEINEINSSIGVRRADIISKDGVEIARSYHRSLFNPGDDLSGQPKTVQDVAAVVWTDDVIVAYEASLVEDELKAEVAQLKTLLS